MSHSSDSEDSLKMHMNIIKCRVRWKLHATPHLPLSRHVLSSAFCLCTCKSQHQALPKSIQQVMPNGRRSSNGSSMAHTSDSEDRRVLKKRRIILKRRVSRRWKQHVCYRKKVRAVASRLQINFFARSEPPLGKEIVDLIAEFVVQA